MIQGSSFIGRRLLAAFLAVVSLTAAAAVPLPVVTAASETFEVVGRLDTDGLVLHVDRAPSNEPVLAANLEVEAGGRTAKAVFRPAGGDYLIADAGWLQPLREPGEHGLALTLVAGEESDLLSGDLLVAAPPVAAKTETGRLLPLLLAAALLAVVIGVGRRLRRVRGGGA